MSWDYGVLLARLKAGKQSDETMEAKYQQGVVVYAPAA